MPSAEPPKYFIRANQRVHGPYSSSQIKQLAAAGKLIPEMEIRQGEEGRWQKAKSVKGLFAAQQPSENNSSENIIEVTEADIIADDVTAVDGQGLDPVLNNGLPPAEQGWVELSTESWMLPPAPPQHQPRSAQPTEAETRASRAAEDYLSRAAQELTVDQFNAHRASKDAWRSNYAWIWDILMALGIAIALQLFCCGVFTILPMTYISKKYYDAGEDSKAMAFLGVGLFSILTGIALAYLKYQLYKYGAQTE